MITEVDIKDILDSNLGVFLGGIEGKEDVVRDIMEIIEKLRAERDAAARDMRERCMKSVRNTIIKIDWPPEDGDELIEDLLAGLFLLATTCATQEAE